MGVCVVVGLVWLFVRMLQSSQQQKRDQPEILFQSILSLLEGGEIGTTETAGTYVCSGTYNGAAFQFKAVADTLATRKLPCLWLLITLSRQQKSSVTIDLMMRPAGVTSFSNFDFLPHTLNSSQVFPEAAVLRSDQQQVSPEVLKAMAASLVGFELIRGKELLVTPNGIRMVVQLAEADHARYGVFRQAEFGDVEVGVELARNVMGRLLALADD